MKGVFAPDDSSDYLYALNINGHFFEKIIEKNYQKLIFRNQLINQIRKL